MRVYYFIEEHFIGAHVGHRDAYERLQKAGLISDYEFLPFEFLKSKDRWEDVLKNAETGIMQFRPDAIIISHTGNCYFPESFFKRVRKAIPGVRFIFDERDVHGIVTKRFPLQLLLTAKNCDTVFLVAEGFYANIYRSFGCRDVRYLPNATDDFRFGKTELAVAGSEFDVVLIGNYVKSRVYSMPGVHIRKSIVDAFTKRYGKRFGLFGRGWAGNPSWQGTCDYNNQEKIIQSAYCSVNSDHFPQYRKYFSDRLPIAIYSGRPVVRYRTAGVPEYFSDLKNMYHFRGNSEAISQVEKIISSPEIFNDSKMIQTARVFVEENMVEISRQKMMLQLQ